MLKISAPAKGTRAQAMNAAQLMVWFFWLIALGVVYIVLTDEKDGLSITKNVIGAVYLVNKPSTTHNVIDVSLSNAIACES